MTGTLVLTTISDAIAFIELNNPGRRNALSNAMLAALNAALVEAGSRNDVSCIVLRGAGPAFSAGHDLAEMQAMTEPHDLDGLFDACVAVMQTLHRVEVPVIAQVHGVATAAGCQLVAACDLAVCTETARFATPGVNIGLFCSTPLVPLSRTIGRKRSMEMLLTGTMIDAQTALSWGLVNQVVADEDIDVAVRALAGRITQASRAVVAIGKRAFWDQIERSEDDAYRATAPVMTDNALLPDAKEGIAAFLEKRAPEWPTGH